MRAVVADDLNTPLGVSKKPGRGRRFPDPFPPLAALVVGVALAVTVWVVVMDDPLGGEPVGRVAITRSPPAPPVADGGKQSAEAPPAAQSQDAGGISSTTAIPAAGPLIIKVPQRGSGVAIDPVSGDDALSESSLHGALPRIADDGRRPMDIYARRTSADPSLPRIALVVSGLGISGDATRQAIDGLPDDVTLAFIPYGDGLPDLVAEARRKGHEVLLQVPMEPFDYPNNDPGPQTLLTALPPSANLDRLHWAMSRAAGYTGIASYMGAKFLTSDEALITVLGEVARRGLFFLDAGGGPAGQSETIATTGALVLRAGIAPASGAPGGEVEAALRRAEETARAQGTATVMLALQPEYLPRLSAWAEGLSQRGVALVPASDLVHRSSTRHVSGTAPRDPS